jgi:anti-sigma B factor antagonist
MDSKVKLVQRVLPGDVVLIEVHGNLDRNSYEELEHAIQSAFRSHQCQLILHLEDVDYMSSTGAGLLVGAIGTASEMGGDLVLLRPSPKAASVLEILGLEEIFKIAQDEDEALRCFRPPCDVARLKGEAASKTEEEFARLHPWVALVVERLAAPPAGAPTVSVEETVTDDAPPRAEMRSATKLNSAARVRWAEIRPGQTSIRIGRDVSCDVSFPHPRVSRHHLTLRRSAATRSWYVDDSGSSNGTLHNGRVAGTGRIADGDELLLAGVVMLRPYFTPAALYRELRGEGQISAR